MAIFVLEIGTEEIPARFLASEENNIVALFEDALKEAGLAHGAITVLSTPRRLGLVIDGMAEYQAASEEVITGPPVAAAYDASGSPTGALLGFMKNHSISLDDIYRLHVAKGEYVAFRKHAGGLSAQVLLQTLIPAVISRLPFVKRMYWGAEKVAYPRPIRWILALLDDKVIDFEYAGVRSGRLIYGHRVHGKGPFQLGHAKDYEDVLRDNAQVIGSRISRKDVIRKKGEELASGVQGRILWDDGLLEEVAGLVEKPVPILGSFDPGYLEIPQEALLCSMQTHQKSFGLSDKDGRLLPYFLTVLNIEPPDKGEVKRGWERVLRARLEDARFFYKTDLSANFRQWLDKLEHVIFMGPLGSMGEKSRRLSSLCVWICDRLGLKSLDQLAARAGLLAKTDLVSAMVGEFDDLQGIMGGIYAQKFGEDERVAQAISEQYLPTGPDSPLPDSDLGSILSIADKADNLAGGFGLDKAPSGVADPNGLRRCALGIIRILLQRQWKLDVEALFTETRKLYGERKWKLAPEEALNKLLDFFRGRLRNYFIGKGYETNMVDAVLASGFADPVDAEARLEALAAFSQKPYFIESAQLLKRIENITKKSGEKGEDFRREKMAEDAEKELADLVTRMGPQIDELIKSGEYAEALEQLGKLKDQVNRFFENVMVMCEDKDMRENRLKLLNAVSARFAPIGAFSYLRI